MKTRLLRTALVAVALTLAGGQVSADDKDKPADAEINEAMENGPGVYAVKRDKQGRITSVLVVGQSRVSTVLGRAKGLRDARDKARVECSAEFRKWLKQDVRLHEKSEEETILFLEGKKDNDEKTVKESGKSVEKSGKKYESVSQGLIRGLQVLRSKTNTKDEICTVVMLWTAKNAKATRNLDRDQK